MIRSIAKRGRKFLGKKYRSLIQVLSLIFFNIWGRGYFAGNIYKGKSKMICVPVLNCYSCPGAWGACPIGSLQAVIGSAKYKISYYVSAMIMLFGLIFGRFICGFLCPFGFLQDILYKIKSKKVKINKKLDKKMRYIKYIIAIVFVILLPTFFVNRFNMASPYFCKYICPAGTLGGGIPLIFMNSNLQKVVGGLFTWKLFILILIIVLSVFISRPFCKYICPLGAFYGLFNKFSLYQLDIDKKKCIECLMCEKSCPMDINPVNEINSAECIKCGQCASKCPQNCISINKKQNKS